MPIQTTEKINKLENEILSKKKELAALKGSLTPKEMPDYSFNNHQNGITKLSEMFGTHKYLVLIHNMGIECKYCTMWANGFEGIYKHFNDKSGFVLINHDSVPTQIEFAKKSGWSFPIYSATESSFSKDLGFTDEKNSPWPGVSTFKKDDSGKIYLLSQANFGPGDDFCSVWHFYDMLPEKFDY